MSQAMMATGLIGLVLSGLIVPAATVEGEDGATLVDRLMQQFEDTVGQARDDVTLLPLRPVDAYGETDGGRIVSLTILARATSALDLAPIVWLDGVDALTVSYSGVRDADGSVATGHATAGDLIRIDVVLGDDMAPGEGLDLSIDAGVGRPATWSLTAPRNTARPLVEMDVDARTQ